MEDTKLKKTFACVTAGDDNINSVFESTEDPIGVADNNVGGFDTHPEVTDLIREWAREARPGDTLTLETFGIAFVCTTGGKASKASLKNDANARRGMRYVLAEA